MRPRRSVAVSLGMAKASDDALRHVDAYARLLDSKFRIPGTDVRFGLEPIAGLVPFAGDAVGFVASGLLVTTMARHGASPRLVARMLVNVGVDALVGSVPVLGSVFDVVFKANDRNVRLLREHYEEGRHTGSVWPIVAATVAALIALAVLLAWVLYEVAAWLWALLSGAL